MNHRENLQREETEALENLRLARENMNLLATGARTKEQRARYIISNRIESAFDELENIVLDALEARKTALKARQTYDDARFHYSNILWRHWKCIREEIMQSGSLA